MNDFEEERDPTPEEEAAEIARLDAETKEFYAKFDKSDLSLQDKFDLDYKSTEGQHHAVYKELMNSKTPPPPPPGFEVYTYLVSEWSRVNGTSKNTSERDAQQVARGTHLGLAFTPNGKGAAGLLTRKSRGPRGGRRTKRSSRKNKRSASKRVKRKRSNRRHSSRK